MSFHLLWKAHFSSLALSIQIIPVTKTQRPLWSKGHLSLQMPGRPCVPQPTGSPTFSQSQLLRLPSSTSPLSTTPESKTSGAQTPHPDPKRKREGFAFTETDGFPLPGPCLSERGRCAGLTLALERRFPAAPAPGGTDRPTDTHSRSRWGRCRRWRWRCSAASCAPGALRRRSGAGRRGRRTRPAPRRTRPAPPPGPRRPPPGLPGGDSGVRTGPDLPGPTLTLTPLAPAPPARRRERQGKEGSKDRRKERRDPARPQPAAHSHLAPLGAGLSEASWRRRAEMPQRRSRRSARPARPSYRAGPGPGRAGLGRSGAGAAPGGAGAPGPCPRVPAAANNATASGKGRPSPSARHPECGSLGRIALRYPQHRACAGLLRGQDTAGCKEGLSWERRTGSALPSPMSAGRTGHTARRGGSSSLAVSLWRLACNSTAAWPPPGSPSFPIPMALRWHLSVVIALLRTLVSGGHGRGGSWAS